MTGARLNTVKEWKRKMQGLHLTHCRNTTKSTDLLTSGHKYVSLVSTDKEGSEKLILYVRYTKNSEIREEYFQC
jgi:hypothetical protein